MFGNILRGIAAALSFSLMWYFSSFTLNPAFGGFWFFVVLIGAVSFGIPAPSELHYNNAFNERGWKRVGLAFLAVVVFLLFTIVSSWAAFHASAYRELLGPVTSGKLEEALPSLDLEQAPLVSESMAERAAEKRLSEVPALGSQVEIGSLEKQIINGKLYWVAFLEHRSFSKWFTQKSTPGYVRVSAHNAEDVHLVQEVDGKKLSLKYLDSSYGFSNAKRHLRVNGFATDGIGDFIPEIDESGRPYLVAALHSPTVGFLGQDANGAAVLDVQTGEVKRYSLTNLPTWIDRIHPESFIKTQLEDRLHLVNGWFNPQDEDRLAISNDLDVVYGADGKSYYFAGLTSVAREGGLVGFMMVNTRTKEVRQFQVSGVTEPVAQSAVEGVMPEKKYEATNALPFLINGTPVYAMALRDNVGIARAYGIVSLTNFQKVAVSNTFAATVREFQNKLAIDATMSNASTQGTLKPFKGKIWRIASEVRGGNTQYTMTLADDETGHLYVAGPDLSDDLALTQSGDLVEGKVVASSSRVQNLQSFVNKTITK